jgi:enolase-phosphatase E1
LLQSPAAGQVHGILLDIEGTTTPIEFVHKTLFSYARQQMQGFLEHHWAEPELGADLDGLRNQYLLDRGKIPQPPLWQEDSENALRSSVLAYINWLMHSDSKCTPLKSLQGKIWREGYASGNLKSEVFADVQRAFLRWAEQGKTISIFSSGSVLAQQLLFANTTSGNLTAFIRGYFDTTTGPKRDTESYQKIAAAVNLAAANMIFVSDIIEELDAARHAGMETALCIRGDGSPPEKMTHKWVRTFDELMFSEIG